MNIGIDIDDVLANFQAAFLPYYNQKHNTSFTIDDIYIYSYPEVFGITLEEALNTVYEFYDTSNFEDILPTEGSQKALELLREDHDLFVITSRPNFLTARTETWIQKYYSNTFNDILHSNQFTPLSEKKILKSSLCQKNDISILIEDAPEHAVDATEHGIHALMLDKPWNRKMPMDKKVTIVHSWKDVPRAVKHIVTNSSR